jgi:hypothetical protein
MSTGTFSFREDSFWRGTIYQLRCHMGHMCYLSYLLLNQQVPLLKLILTCDQFLKGSHAATGPSTPAASITGIRRTIAANTAKSREAERPAVVF